MTRNSTLKAITRICTSDSQLSVENELSALVPELCNLLHKNLRSLKLHTLETLNAIVIKYGKSITKNLNTILDEVLVFISEEDLTLAAHALQIAKNIVVQDQKLTAIKSAVEKSIKFSTGHFIQGNSLKNVLEFFKFLASIKSSHYSNDDMVQKLLNNVNVKAICTA